MRRYEMIGIIHPDASEEKRNTLFDRVRDIIARENGFLVEIDEWGNQKLAYEIRKKKRGYYVRFDLCGPVTLTQEIERFFRIQDPVMKYMTVLLEKDADVDRLRAEAEARIAKAESEAAATETTPEETEAAVTETTPEKTEAEAVTTETPTAGTGDGIQSAPAVSEASDSAETAPAPNPEVPTEITEES
jgi:small subunit ribosomal protein S6